MLDFRILEKCKQYPCVWVAFSGGVDSHVLLHLLKEAGVFVKAVHVNHNLQQDAKAWTAHCLKICEELNVELKVLEIDNFKKNEATARQKRYEAIASCIKEPLLLAHHLDDQTETVILRMLRGAGPKGLIGMQEVSKNFGLTLIRPLLSISKEKILEYAKKYKLSWEEDKTNKENDFDRNFLRNEIIPKLKSRWSVNQVLQKVSASCLEMENSLSELLKPLIKEYVSENHFMIPNQPNSVMKQLLRYWLKEFELSRVNLDTIVNELIHAKQDASPKLKLNQHWLRRYENALYLIDFEEKVIENVFSLNENICDILIDGFCIKKEDLIPLSKKYTGKIEIKFWQKKGEKIYLKQTKSLKKYFQELKIPPWNRLRVPLVVVDGKIVEVLGKYS